jgi:hypothetical protein
MERATKGQKPPELNEALVTALKPGVVEVLERTSAYGHAVGNLEFSVSANGHRH